MFIFFFRLQGFKQDVSPLFLALYVYLKGQILQTQKLLKFGKIANNY